MCKPFIQASKVTENFAKRRSQDWASLRSYSNSNTTSELFKGINGGYIKTDLRLLQRILQRPFDDCIKINLRLLQDNFETNLKQH